MPNNAEQEALIGALMKDITGDDVLNVNKDEITDTISNILQQYNLRTDLSFIEKIANMKLPGKKEGRVNLDELPTELRDAAFLPVNTIADIA